MLRSSLRLAIAALLVTSALPTVAQTTGHTIDQSRGVDARVDYASLAGIGPWDDRNYQLTQEDIALLTDNERELNEGIPAFYRVHLRRTFLDMPRTGELQYPRSGLPRFLNEYGGYLIDGKVYTQVEHHGNSWLIDTSKGGVLEKAFIAQRALEGDVRVTTPIGAAESSIEINPVNPMQVVAGSNGPGGGQRMHYSTDGGETWTQSAALPLGGTCCDPTIDWSSDGTKVYAATLGSGVFVYRSADGGQTWTDLDTEPGNDPRRELGGGVDKEFLHVDRYPTSPHLDNVYLSWHQANIQQFACSTDFGHTWTSQNFGSDPRGIGSDITTDKGGTVYYFWPNTSGRLILLKRSTDGGVTFEAGTVTVATTEGSFIFPLPSTESREVFIYTSVDVDYSDGPFGDSIYAAWTDNTGPDSGTAANNHGRIQVGYSRDGGDTWTLTTPHETADANTVDRWHQWLAVGPDGKVYVMFYDTRVSGRTSVDVFYSVSSDGAQTWSTPARLTTATSPNSTSGFEFGDYNGMDVAVNQLITIFSDNRDENGGGAQSMDVYSAGLLTGETPIFEDGFESNGTTMWDFTMP